MILLKATSQKSALAYASVLQLIGFWCKPYLVFEGPDKVVEVLESCHVAGLRN